MAADSWRARAACKGKTNLFFSGNQTELAEAKQLCDGCHVKGHCLADVVLYNHEVRRSGRHDDYLEYGVWAGSTRNERAAWDG